MVEKSTSKTSTASVTPNARLAINSLNAAIKESGLTGIPLAKPGNFKEVSNALFNSVSRMNAIMPTVIDKIVTSTFQKPFYEGTLSKFLNPGNPFGNYEEELIQQPGEGYDWDAELSASRELSREGLPDIRAAYHPLTRNRQYPLYLDKVQMMTAVTDYESFGAYMFSLVQTHILMRRNMERQGYFIDLLTAGFTNGASFRVVMPDIEDNEVLARRLVKQIKSYASKMTAAPQRWNEAGVLNVNERDTLYLVTTPAVWAELEVEVQSMAFNVEFTNTNIETIIVDQFGDPTIQAMLIDRKFVQYTPTYENTEYNILAAGRSFKIFGNDVGRGYYSPFRNSVAWVTDIGEYHGKLYNMGQPGVITSPSRPSHQFTIEYEMFKGAPPLVVEDGVPPIGYAVRVEGDSQHFTAEMVTDEEDVKPYLKITRRPTAPQGARANVIVEGYSVVDDGVRLAPIQVLVQEGF